MAVRRRELYPDQDFTTRQGETLAVVSEEQFLNELLALGQMQMFAGGVITSLVFRQPTGLDGEMVTVGAVLEWKDRTDARAQPEPVAQPQGFAKVVASNETRDGRQSLREMLDEEDARIREALAADGDLDIRVEAGSLAAPSVEDEIASAVGEQPREPAPPVSADDVDDGLQVDEDAVDESAVPEGSR